MMKMFIRDRRNGGGRVVLRLRRALGAEYLDALVVAEMCIRDSFFTGWSDVQFIEDKEGNQF